jgi:hypothetical protein
MKRIIASTFFPTGFPDIVGWKIASSIPFFPSRTEQVSFVSVSAWICQNRAKVVWITFRKATLSQMDRDVWEPGLLRGLFSAPLRTF